MDHFITIWSVVVFVENRLQTGIDYGELSKATGFSLPHLRAVFSGQTGKSLSRYILSRRIAHAAFNMVHSDESILSIATKYGFSNPDTFTRAFKRMNGLTPQAFRKQRRSVGRIKLCAGVYGVSERMESMNHEKKTSADSTILYGVPKVGYGVYGCTPYPICLKAAANYLGEDVDYDYAMACCGAAFRLVWDETGWNGGNVDIMLAFDDPVMAYQSGIEALGRTFRLLGRENRLTRSDPAKYSSLESGATREDFMAFIKEHIDRGIPCIALGIIGPPEACLITGYRDGGKTLLGWNFFQDSPEFAARVDFDDSGYFITDAWWENEDTVAVMSMGDKDIAPMTPRQLVDRAVTVLTGRRHGDYAKGIAAYDAWKRAITDDSQFPREPIMPILVERLMCQGDAMDCLADGRDNARKFFEKWAQQNPDQPLYRDIAEQFGKVARSAYGMYETLGGWQRDEKQLKALIRLEIRQRLAELIDACKAADEQALKLLRRLQELL